MINCWAAEHETLSFEVLRSCAGCVTSTFFVNGWAAGYDFMHLLLLEKLLCGQQPLPTKILTHVSTTER